MQEHPLLCIGRSTFGNGSRWWSLPGYDIPGTCFRQCKLFIHVCLSQLLIFPLFPIKVIGTIVQQNQFKKGDPTDVINTTKSFNYAFWCAAAFGYFAFFAAIPGLWGIGILNKTGESARVEHLVAAHHEKEVIGIKEKEADPEAVTNVVSARS